MRFLQTYGWNLPPRVAREEIARAHRKLDRREAFPEAAETLEATFIPGKRSHGDEVHWKRGPWPLILDTYTQSNGHHR